MQVRVFESDNMDSALRQIKEALGPDALILSSRTVRKGGMGLFGKPILEVTAAVDPATESDSDQPQASSFDNSSRLNAALTKQLEKQSYEENSEAPISYQEIWQQEQQKREVDTRPNPYARSIQPEQPRLNELQSEVGELRDLIKNLVRELALERRCNRYLKTPEGC